MTYKTYHVAIMILVVAVLSLFAIRYSLTFAHGDEQAEITSGPTGVLPDSLMFGVDRVFEKMGDMLTFSASGKLDRQMDHAQERLTELSALVKKERAGFVPKTLGLYEEHIASAAVAVGKMEGDRDIAVGQMTTALFTHREILAGFYVGFDDANKAVARTAIDKADAVIDEVLAYASDERRKEFEDVRVLYDAEVEVLIADPRDVMTPPMPHDDMMGDAEMMHDEP